MGLGDLGGTKRLPLFSISMPATGLITFLGVSSIVLDVVAASQDIRKTSAGTYKRCFITSIVPLNEKEMVTKLQVALNYLQKFALGPRFLEDAVSN